MNKASDAAFDEAANIIGCGVPAIRAVFEIEAGGKFFDAKGNVIRRFEPHHFPRNMWDSIGFKPGSVKPWQASLNINTRTRAIMFTAASNLNPEAAARASSWGAPQIMGFNAKWAGYATALEMVAAFRLSADNQVHAFARFVVAQGLDKHVRAQDWLAFATAYNGTGKAKDYAAKIEAAYRRASGGARSSVIVRVGQSGESVHALQARLVELGLLGSADGSFGPKTDEAVRKFQQAHGLPADGLVGARTWEALRSAVPYATHEPAVQPDEIEVSMKGALQTIAAGGGGSVVGTFLGDLGESAQLLLVGGFVLAGAVVLAVWALPKLRRALA